MSEKSRLLKAAGVVGSATLLSRILGFARDAVIAWYFGAGYSSDAFIAAFRIPNLLRRLFAEGSLSAAFIPVLITLQQPHLFLTLVIMTYKLQLIDHHDLKLILQEI